MTDCQICFDPFNGSSRKKCACPYCNVGYCRECVGTWLTTIVDEPRCPNEQCKKAWSREFLDTIVTKVWRDSVYREYRERLLMDRERAMLPATQPRIEAIHEAKRLEKELVTPMRERRKEILTLMRQLEAETQGIQTQIWDITNRAERLRQGIGFDDSASKSRNIFIRRCPAENCRGFLSSAWKCGVCELFSCPDCQEVKGVARDSAHTCDPGALETAKLIAKDTKACPKCGEMITKIDGCFTKDTPILLWNGQTKMSQDISVGDTLIGDDGEKRIVQELCSGGDEMFRVSQKNGMNYTVNSKHKLALKIEDSDVIHEITVDDYLKLPYGVKNTLLGFNKDMVCTSIEVSSVGQGTYYGWSVDSNKRFLLPDHTVVRNCDQMWCVSCHTAFSWRTGQVATGIVHNPHYYEFQRRINNGEAPRNAGDIPCGGLADWATLRNSLLTAGQRATRAFPPWFVTLEYAHRRINHVLNVDMVQLAQNAVNINDNIDLRISYLLNEISEPAMMGSLQTREKKREKELEIRRVYETLTGAATDIFRRMILTSEEKGQLEENFKPFLNELDQLRIFINEALDVLRRRYSCTLHGFDGNWERMALKMTKTKAGDETKTIYGMFVEELAKFETEFSTIVVPTPLENGSVWVKPWISKTRKLEQRVRTFPSDPTSIRYANSVVSFYENSVRAMAYTTGTVVSLHHRTMYERSRDRARPDFEKWKTHVTTLALTIEKPTNAIE
uniref:RING-type domain-containing protein n=1 Tax=viral metagenome TaxID=1070528 RepID=A0A6C0KZZ6_9ZZZZ